MAVNICKCVHKNGVYERIQTCEGCDFRYWEYCSYADKRAFEITSNQIGDYHAHEKKYAHKTDPKYIRGRRDTRSTGIREHPDTESESDFQFDSEGYSDMENDPIVTVTYCGCILCIPKTGEKNIQCSAKAKIEVPVEMVTHLRTGEPLSVSEMKQEPDSEFAEIEEDICKLKVVIASEIGKKIEKTESEIKSEINATISENESDSGFVFAVKKRAL